MKKIHFSADLHSSHPKIVDICNRPIYLDPKIIDELKRKNNGDIEYNIYKDKEYLEQINLFHDEWLIREVINKWVDKKDTLYLLGDISLGSKINAERFIDRLNGNKFLLLGNHDKNIYNSTRFSQITQIKDFTFSQFGLNIHICLCHYKMVSWNRKEHNSWMLHGHSHCKPTIDVGLSFDVGIDRIGFWRPYNLYEICKIMNGKQLGYSEDDIIKSL